MSRVELAVLLQAVAGTSIVKVADVPGTEGTRFEFDEPVDPEPVFDQVRRLYDSSAAPVTDFWAEMESATEMRAIFVNADWS